MTGTRQSVRREGRAGEMEIARRRGVGRGRRETGITSLPFLS